MSRIGQVGIVAVVPTLRDDPSETIESILEQTIRVSNIFCVVGSQALHRSISSLNSTIIEIIFVKPDLNKCLGKRVAKALNTALRKVDLDKYDYILRVDADTKLPNNFIEENLKKNADCVGTSGYAMLINKKAFLEVFHGRFPEVCGEDSYFCLKLLSRGYIVKPWTLPPISKRESRVGHPWSHHFNRGEEMYKLGYEPFHVFNVLRTTLKNPGVLFIVMGYGIAILKQMNRYKFARWVFRRQLKRLVFGK